MKIEIKKTNPNAVIPQFGSNWAAGIDLRACIEEPLELKPNESKIISTGIAVNIREPNIAIQIIPRSGLGAKQGIVLGNLVGLIDADYQGEIMLTPWNRSNISYIIQPNLRLAQMIFVPIIRPEWKEVLEFSTKTERGTGGFGHSGEF